MNTVRDGHQLSEIMTQVGSPCIKVCTLEDDMCIGCFRTQDEIREWMIYTDEQKKIVIDQLEERKTLHNTN